MSPLTILGVALTRHHIGLVVLSLERLERHELFAVRGRSPPIDRLRRILALHRPRCVAFTCARRQVAHLPALRDLESLLASEDVTTVEHADLLRQARAAGLAPTKRARAVDAVARFPSLRPRLPPHVPTRGPRTAFERHHEPVFRALLAAELLLRERLIRELPLPYEPPSAHPT